MSGRRRSYPLTSDVPFFEYPDEENGRAKIFIENRKTRAETALTTSTVVLITFALFIVVWLVGQAEVEGDNFIRRR